MKLPTKILENAVTEISKLPGIGKKNCTKAFLISSEKRFTILKRYIKGNY